MKKALSFVFAVAAAAALASCSREDMIAGPDFQKGQTVEMDFTAGFRNLKTVLGEAGKVSWAAADTFYMSDGTKVDTIAIPAACAKAEFTAAVTAGADNFVGVYAKGEGLPVFNGDQVTLVNALLPERNGSFDEANIMVAKSDTTELNFHHAVGILKFSVSSADISKVAFRGDGLISGKVKIQAMDDDDPVFNFSFGYDFVKVNVDGRTGDFFVALPPCILPAGTTFMVEKTDGSLYGITATQDNEIECGHIYDMGALDAKCTAETKLNARYEKVTAAPEDWTDGCYLLAATAGGKTFVLDEVNASEIGIGVEETDKVSGTNIVADVDNWCRSLRIASAGEGLYNIFFQGSYLAAKNGNNLQAKNTIAESSAATGQWTITIDGSAKIFNKQYNTRYIRWNNSSPRFACYTSVQTNVDLYAFSLVEAGAKDIQVDVTSIDAPGYEGEVSFKVTPANIAIDDLEITSSIDEITVKGIDASGNVTIQLEENGGTGRDAVITVASKSDGTVEPKQVTVSQRAYLEGIAELNGAIGNDQLKYTVKISDAVVTYATSDKKKAYIQDENAGIYVYLYNEDANLVAGNVFNGYLACEAKAYYNCNEIVALGYADIVKTSGDAPVPASITMTELLADFASYEGMIIKISGATVTDGIAGSTDKSGALKVDEATLAIYSQLGAVTAEAGSVIDIIGFPTFNKEEKQISVWEQDHIEFISRAAYVDIAAAKDMVVEDTWTLDATTNSSATITYESSNPDVVSITGGVALAVSAGTAVITAKVAADGIFTAAQAECTVSVSAYALATTLVTYDFNNKANFPAGFPTTSATAGSGTIDIDMLGAGQKVTLYAPGSYYILNHNSTTGTTGLFYGKTSSTFANSAYLEFPGKEGYKLTHVRVIISKSTAGKIAYNIYSTTGTAMSTTLTTTASTGETFDFDLVGEANTPYRLTSLTDDKNCQIYSIICTYTKVE